jgi:hypothetical protein
VAGSGLSVMPFGNLLGCRFLDTDPPRRRTLPSDERGKGASDAARRVTMPAPAPAAGHWVCDSGADEGAV